MGSINFAIIITKIFTKKDIRESGSGNAGFTNVLRTVGKLPSVLTLLGDILKAVVAVLLGIWFVSLFTGNPDLPRFGGYAAAGGAIIGHMFPVYYGFKGGKGILVTAGALLVLDPLTLLVILCVFLIVVAITRIVSISSICAAIAFPITTVISRAAFKSEHILFDTAFAVLIAAIVIFMHRENIKRLLNGTEKKLGKSK